MGTLDFREFSDEFVFYFGGEPNEIHARTLTNSLNHLINTLELINDHIEPGSDIQVFAHATASGSFKIKLSKKQRKLLKNAWKDAKSVGLMVLAAVIATKLSSAEQKVENHYHISGDVIIVQHNEVKVVLPKEAQKALDNVYADERVDSELSESFTVLLSDERITGFGITKELTDEVPFAHIGRNYFGVLSTRKNPEETGERKVDSNEELQILKAVFERGRRKWQFIRKGAKVSAPILDVSFYDRLAERDVILGDGDTLVVMLRTHQIWNDLIGVWVDDHYEVIKVFEHHKRMKQTALDID